MTADETIFFEKFKSNLFELSEYRICHDPYKNDVNSSISDVTFKRLDGNIVISAPYLSEIVIPEGRFSFIIKNGKGSITYKKQNIRIESYGEQIFQLIDEDGNKFRCFFNYEFMNFLTLFLLKAESVLIIIPPILNETNGMLSISSNYDSFRSNVSIVFDKDENDFIKTLLDFYFNNIQKEVITFDFKSLNSFLDANYPVNFFIDYQSKFSLNTYSSFISPRDVSSQRLIVNLKSIFLEEQKEGISLDLKKIQDHGLLFSELEKKLTKEQIEEYIIVSRLYNLEKKVFYIFENELEEIDVFKEIYEEAFEQMSLDDKLSLNKKMITYSKMFKTLY